MTYFRTRSCRVVSRNQDDLRVVLVGIICTVIIFATFTVAEQVDPSLVLVLTP